MIIDSHSHSLSPLAVVNLPVGESPEPGFIYSAGIHPWNADKVDDTVREWFCRVVDLPEVVAIGECGIDAVCGVDLVRQTEVFRHMIEVSERIRKPMVIHCVRAWHQLFSLYNDVKPSQRWVIHGFRGKPELALRLLGCGFFLSYGSRFNAESLRITPDNRLLVESDEYSIYDSYAEIASVRGLTVAELESIVAENNLCVFS